MKKSKLAGVIASLAFLTLVTGCSAKVAVHQEINSGGKKVTILSAKPTAKAESVTSVNDFGIEKIEIYPGVKGEDWLSDEIILMTKENLNLKPIKVFDQMSNIRNLYSYDLKSREEKSIYKNTEYMWMPIVSPYKKYIFSENLKPEKSSGLVLDLNGNIIKVVDDKITKEFNTSFNNAKWVDDVELIVPSGESIYLINVNYGVSKIENVGRMQMDYAVKSGNKIYYISVERKLIEYDINTKQRKVIKDNVLSFELSPGKDMFAIEKKVSENKEALVLIDIQGNEKATLAEGKMIFGISFSPDQSKIAYVITSEDESKKGLYVSHIASNKSVYVSPDFVGIENGLKWSPSSKKILTSIGEVKDMKAIDNTYVISIR